MKQKKDREAMGSVRNIQQRDSGFRIRSGITNKVKRPLTQYKIEIRERDGTELMKRIVLLALIVVFMVIISSSVFAADKDKYSEWIGPSKGVSYRYGRNYLGENQWSPYPNYVQFWNGNPYRVKITFFETLSGKEYGPYIQFLGPSSDSDPGIKVAIPKDAKVSSITVEVLQ